MVTNALDPRPGTRAVRFKRIFVLDPDEMWGRKVQKELATGGYRVIYFSNPDDAYPRLFERPADLVVVAKAVGTWALETLRRYVGALRTKPEIILIEDGNSAPAFESMCLLKPSATLTRPCSARHVLEQAARLLGPPWVDLEE